MGRWEVCISAKQWISVEGFLGISSSELSHGIMYTKLSNKEATFHAGPPAPNGVDVDFEQMVVSNGDDEYPLRLEAHEEDGSSVYYDASDDASGSWRKYTASQAYLIQTTLAAGLDTTTLHLENYSYEISLKSNPMTQTNISTQSERNIRIEPSSADGAESAEEEGDDQYDQEVPKEFTCPIGVSMMKDPVTIASGHVYEKKHIVKWLLTKNTCPMTGGTLAHTQITPDLRLMREIKAWIEKHKMTDLDKDPARHKKSKSKAEGGVKYKHSAKRARGAKREGGKVDNSNDARSQLSGAPISAPPL